MESYPLVNIPETPGIYMFKGERGNILYVGKARNLKNRVSSYFSGKKPVRTALMVQMAKDISFVSTNTEAEALLLEANVIKTEQPKFNVRLKDSKSYPYIKITNHKYPKLAVTRDTSKKDGIYFGPFVDAGSLRGVVDEILRAFPLRSCTETKFREGRRCLKYQIKKCLGPCEELISFEEYRELVGQIEEFFKGRTSDVKDELKDRMQELSNKMMFEEAAKVRDRLQGIDRLFQRQSVTSADGISSIDIFVPHTFMELSGITVLFIREGKLIGSTTEFFEEVVTPELMETFVVYFYNTVRQFPESIAVNGLEDSTSLQDALQELKGGKITVRTRGIKAFVELAEKNAYEQTEAHIRKMGQREDVNRRLAELAGAEARADAVECVDISHISGTNTVGVSVRSLEGVFDKKHYRKYRIKSVDNDDFTALYELFTRKFANIAEGSEKKADVYIIDGGIGQLNAVSRAADDAGADANLISISKGRSIKGKEQDGEQSIESVHLPGRKNPVKLKRSDPLLLFIQKMRDESHRFAITYSRQLALKELKNSPLLEVEGFGEKRLRKLLEAHPDLFAPDKEVTPELIAETGTPHKTAVKVYDMIESMKNVQEGEI